MRIAVLLLALVSSQLVLAGSPNSAVVASASVPAIGQVGLIALSIIVGLIGARYIKRFRK